MRNGDLFYDFTFTLGIAGKVTEVAAIMGNNI